MLHAHSLQINTHTIICTSTHKYHYHWPFIPCLPVYIVSSFIRFLFQDLELLLSTEHVQCRERTQRPWHAHYLAHSPSLPSLPLYFFSFILSFCLLSLLLFLSSLTSHCLSIRMCMPVCVCAMRNVCMQHVCVRVSVYVIGVWCTRGVV